MNRFKIAAVSAAFIFLGFISSAPVLLAEDDATAPEPAAENKETKMLTDADIRAAINADQGQAHTTDSNVMQKIKMLQNKLSKDGNELTALNEQAEKLLPEIQAACAHAEAPECETIKQKAQGILGQATGIQDQMKRDQVQLWEIMTAEQKASEAVPSY